MKFFLVCIIFMNYMYAYSYNDVLKDYEAGRFEKVCDDGAIFYMRNDKNENILTAIGDACARVDSINPLAAIVKNLISTKEFRESGSYFATLVLQKKLIYQFMNDNINLKELRLPRTNHVLSRVFENLATDNYKVVDEGLRKIEISTPEMDYVLWLSSDDPKKVFIDEYKNGKLLQRHWYL
ncbi:MAG: hypothetical protein PHR87_12715 [Sulfurospirillaceae bacterium]|nr:hypothetical protein [Sulfurospirillaceae bacterium]